MSLLADGEGEGHRRRIAEREGEGANFGSRHCQSRRGIAGRHRHRARHIGRGGDPIDQEKVASLHLTIAGVASHRLDPGFDDLPLAERAIPRLTTIRQDLREGARAMVTALFARIAGEEVPGYEMAPELIGRDSA